VYGCKSKTIIFRKQTRRVQMEALKCLEMIAAMILIFVVIILICRWDESRERKIGKGHEFVIFLRKGHSLDVSIPENVPCYIECSTLLGELCISRDNGEPDITGFDDGDGDGSFTTLKIHQPTWYKNTWVCEQSTVRIVFSYPGVTVHRYPPV
jgi:hypothetical protein